MTNVQRVAAVVLAVASSLAAAAPAADVPSIASLSPTSAIVGANGVRLTVNGAGFARTSVVRWKGVDRPTTFVGTGQLQADIPAADLGTLGAAQVTVFNQGGNGGLSNVSSFTVGNPLPVLASVSPSPAMAGGEPFNLVLAGSNFVAGTVVRWNGVARQTTFLSSTRVMASIPASDVATAGTAQIRAFTPAPLGGSSAAVSLAVAV